ncbi:hypothetical protein Lnau_1200 [Legionella nautarum]|uniref:Transmembrane protein n=1 Tax=Legionella nautarum TaxID=45070 RepID=A0A0W0WV71_9GAMM|nr:hypothetical protein [Legionella nautarum]KTD36216.1 hypothetical protein Lnau_1200 [Legionella nautarum]
MLHHARRLENASSTFFFFGFAISQLRFAPFFIAAFAKITSLLLYLVAYGLWLTASLFYPDHPRLQREWYGFAQFKNQHQIAAILGGIAIIFSVLAFIFPMLALPASWLFVFSNCVWLIGEYHKQQNPLPYEEDYSSERQSIYVIYASLVTTMACITAIATTVIAFWPAAMAVTVLLTSIFAILIGAATFRYWAEYTFFEHNIDKKKGSYNTLLANELAPRQRVQLEPTESASARNIANYTPIFIHHSSVSIPPNPSLIENPTQSGSFNY